MVRFQFPTALVMLYPDIDGSVRSEGKDVTNLDIPENPCPSLEHLMARE